MHGGGGGGGGTGSNANDEAGGGGGGGGSSKTGGGTVADGVQAGDGQVVITYTLPTYTVDDAALPVTYDGWRGVKAASADGGTFRVSNVTNQTARVSFGGTAITWESHQGPNMGKAGVIIDGVNKGTFDLFNSTNGPYSHSFTGLSPANHILLVGVTGIKSSASSGYNVAVDAFNILNEVNYSSFIGNLSSPFFGQAIAAKPPRRLQLSFRLKF